jgi:hypothetical protein
MTVNAVLSVERILSVISTAGSFDAPWDGGRFDIKAIAATSTAALQKCLKTVAVFFVPPTLPGILFTIAFPRSDDALEIIRAQTQCTPSEAPGSARRENAPSRARWGAHLAWPLDKKTSRFPDESAAKSYAN